MNKKETFILFFVFLSVWFRLIPHPPNISPITSLALFSGVTFSKRWLSIIVPLIAMILSDMVLGFYPISIWVYISFILITIFGWVTKNTNSKNVFISSVIFFIVSNFGVFVLGYPHTFEGLLTCYYLAIPFFGLSIVGDQLWNFIINKIYLFTKEKVLYGYESK
jgi:hypothetical protein